MGRYMEAREEYSTVLMGRDAPAGADRALLGLARLALAAENPGRDERQAAMFLDRLVREYPESGWIVEARTWRDLLRTLDRLQGDVRRHQHDLQRVRRLRERDQQEVVRLRQERERLRQIDLELERSTVPFSTPAQGPVPIPRESRP
jgi:hypothetical protein